MYFQICWYPQLFKDVEEMHEPVMRSCIETAREEGREKGEIPMMIALYEDGQPVEYIAKIAKMPVEKVHEIIDKYERK